MALSNIKIVGPNAADSLTSLAASPAVETNTPLTNLQSHLRARVVRSTSLTTQVITGDWATAPSIGAVAIGRHNLDAKCTWQVELYAATGLGGSKLYDSGATVALAATGWDANTSVLWLTSAVTPLSMRLTIASTEALHPADGYFEVSRLIMGPVWSPAVNATHDGWMSAWKEDTRQVRTGAGSIRSETGPAYRALTLATEMLTESERASLWEVLRQVGMRLDVLVSGYPGGDAAPDRDHLMMAKVVEMPDFQHPYHGRWSTRLRFEET